MNVLCSIHDVFPDTFDRVEAITGWMASLGLPPAPLLVSPGRQWDPGHVTRLRDFVDKGHELVGHGWLHHAATIRGFRHRLYSTLFSRNCAEHLALSSAEINAMVQRCFEWFEDNRLPSPKTYVPPAWGVGSLSRSQMRELPFRWYETLFGIYDSTANIFHRLPLTGFQADTLFRQFSVGTFNRLNTAFGRWTGIPVRVAIHPDDPDLRLRDSLTRLLTSPLRCITVDEIAGQKKGKQES